MQFGYIPITLWRVHYARGCVCLQNQSVFLSVRVLFKMEPERHAGLRGCRRPLLEFGRVKLLLEVVAFICQRGRAARSGIPRSSADWFASVLLCFGRVSNCIDWDKQIHFYALLKRWFRCIIWIQQSEAAICSYLPSYIFTFFLFKFSVSLCAALLPAFRNEKDKSTARLLLLVRYCGCSLWPSWGQRIWR